MSGLASGAWTSEDDVSIPQRGRARQRSSESSVQETAHLASRPSFSYAVGATQCPVHRVSMQSLVAVILRGATWHTGPAYAPFRADPADAPLSSQEPSTWPTDGSSFRPERSGGISALVSAQPSSRNNSLLVADRPRTHLPGRRPACQYPPPYNVTFSLAPPPLCRGAGTAARDPCDGAVDPIVSWNPCCQPGDRR